jgi:hypothetical protein
MTCTTGLPLIVRQQFWADRHLDHSIPRTLGLAGESHADAMQDWRSPLRLREAITLKFIPTERSTMMKFFLSFLLSLLLIPCFATALLAQDSIRPNIILILSDDQAWTDYGFMGHPDVRTPHLDRLANRSLVFERGYVAAPLCRPSLASILTGRYPRTHGVVGNDVNGNNDRERLDEPVRERFHQLPSFVRLLSASGYLTHQ